MATRNHALYRLLDRPAPDAAKGGCFLSGSQDACIDTGVLVDFDGTLTISIRSLQELCEVAGFSFNAEAIKLEQDLAHAQAANGLLIQEKADLLSQLDAVAQAVMHAAQPRSE